MSKIKYLVLEKNGAEMLIVSKEKVITQPLHQEDAHIQRGQWIILNEKRAQLIADPTKTDIYMGQVVVEAVITGAFDQKDPDYAGLLQTSIFLHVSRGILEPELNDNMLRGCKVALGYNNAAKMFEVVAVFGKNTGVRAAGVIYAIEEDFIRLHAPGWPLDFKLSTATPDKDNLLGQWFVFPVPQDGVKVQWQNAEHIAPKIYTCLLGKTVIVQAPCKLVRDGQAFKTDCIQYAIDPFQFLTVYMLTHKIPTTNAFFELCPLDCGQVRLMASDTQPFMAKNEDGFDDNQPRPITAANIHICGYRSDEEDEKQPEFNKVQQLKDEDAFLASVFQHKDELVFAVDRARRQILVLHKTIRRIVNAKHSELDPKQVEKEMERIEEQCQELLKLPQVVVKESVERRDLLLEVGHLQVYGDRLGNLLREILLFIVNHQLMRYEDTAEMITAEIAAMNMQN